MAAASEQTGFGRLEDFISFAKTGAKIRTAVALKKQFVSQKVHPGDTEEMKGEVDMYLLSAVFTFNIGNDERSVSKIYMFGSSGEATDDAKVHVHIANARLKDDYKRLKDVNLSFEESYF